MAANVPRMPVCKMTPVQLHRERPYSSSELVVVVGGGGFRTVKLVVNLHVIGALTLE